MHVAAPRTRFTVHQRNQLIFLTFACPDVAAAVQTSPAALSVWVSHPAEFQPSHYRIMWLRDALVTAASLSS